MEGIKVMSDKIVSINGIDATGELVVVDEVVTQLTEMLNRAKSGNIIGITAAVLAHNKQAEFYISGRCGGFQMIGAMDIAKHHLIRGNLKSTG